MALWGLWLEETLRAPVPHRHVVLTVPKRLRPYFLYKRALLGNLARVAARTVTSFIWATAGSEPAPEQQTVHAEPDGITLGQVDGRQRNHFIYGLTPVVLRRFKIKLPSLVQPKNRPLKLTLLFWCVE